MAKKEFICKLLSLFAVMGTLSASGLFHQNACAMSAEEILTEITEEHHTTIRKIDRELRGETFEDYINISSIRASEGFQRFVGSYYLNPALVDSALFLSLLARMQLFIAGAHNRHLDGLKESLFQRMILLRSPEEFRNDKFIVARFDEYFDSSIKTLFKQFRPQARSYSKTHRKTHSETGMELPSTP